MPQIQTGKQIVMPIARLGKESVRFKIRVALQKLLAAHFAFPETELIVFAALARVEKAFVIPQILQFAILIKNKLGIKDQRRSFHRRNFF